MTVKPIPDGYHTVTPYLTVSDATAVIEFLKKGVGAEVKALSEMGGRVLNAELRIGTSMVMIASAYPGQPTSPAMLYLYVPDVDAAFARAVAAGGKVAAAVQDQFYGDRSGGVSDPAGNQWWFATRIEDVSGEEVARRAKKQYS